MGQSSSTQREQRHTSPPEYFVPPLSERGQGGRNEDMDGGLGREQARGSYPSLGAELSNGGVQASPSNRRLSVPDTWPSNPRSSGVTLPRSLRSVQEDGAPFDLSNREYRSTTFARMAARRQSTMSRLGSRILPNSVIRGLLSSEEETPAEGLAHRHGIVSRSIPRSETVHGSGRFSPFTSLGSRGITRRRSTRAAYFLSRGDQTLISDTPSSSQLDSMNDRSPEPSRGTRRRSARLHRVRNSLSNPISHMFGPSSSSTPNQDVRNYEQHRPPHSAPGEANDVPFPPPGAMDSHMDFDEPPHELDSVEPAVRNPRPSTPIPPQSNGGPFPGFLRARSSRVLRREEQTPLSRVLQLAAAAIAAQLSGATGPMVPNIQALGNDGLGGSFENFIQTLQQSRSAQANNTIPTDGQRPPGDNGSPSPANFLRVFRFANSESTNDPGNPGIGMDRMDVDGSGERPEGRTVTLVVVGVRSVPSNNDTGDRPPNTGPGLDALLRLPFLSPGNTARNRDNGSNGTPRAGERPRFVPGRRPAANSSAPSGNPDANEAGAPNPSRSASDAGTRSPASSFPTVLSESPPGPNPPPSTPAEPGLSAVSSGASTPSRRPSSASAMPTNPLPHLHEYQSMQPTVEPAEDNIPMNTARQRRRSDSEYARHRDLGSGSVRRNGVVEPDDATPPTGRSWLIYVVGTNLSENHPAFAAPSLFTDNPTYEDMILLSSLLGPAKPPVATRDDVNSAGGLFRLMEYGGSLVAEEVDGASALQIREGERCLICLSEYEAAEEIRQLAECKHVYHRECIDQWLTTGRNSCPLCRGQGVAESTSPPPEAQGTAT